MVFRQFISHSTPHLRIRSVFVDQTGCASRTNYPLASNVDIVEARDWSVGGGDNTSRFSVSHRVRLLERRVRLPMKMLNF